MPNDESKSNGGKAAGIGIGVIIVALLSRGLPQFAKLQDDLDRDAKRTAAQDARYKQLQDEAQRDADRYFQNQNAYTQVKALQNKFELSDEQFEAVLRAEWKAGHPDAEGGPWMIRLGQTGPDWWQQFQSWDIESVKRRCAAASASPPKPSTP
jgi:hypothetical protein